MRIWVRSIAGIMLVLVGAAPVGAQPVGTAVLTGRVFVESTLRPIAEAEVSLPDLALSARSDDKGAFVLRDIPRGTHLVRVRRLGFAVFEARLEFQDGKTVNSPVVLPQLTVLDSVRVVGEVFVPLSFLEHRALGLGHFLTREDLGQQRNMRLPNLLAQIPGLGVAHGRANQGWVLSKRVVPRLSSIGQRNKYENLPGRDLYFPDTLEKRAGAPIGCYARVYLDRTLLNPTTPAEPVNINEFSVRGLEGVEYFASPSQTPIEYSRLNSNYGVLVLHTRRSP